MTLTEQIRGACREVAETRARSVRIDHDRLSEYARTLPLENLVAPTIDPKSHFIESSPADTIAFFITLDTINFGSGYFPHLNKRSGMSGYFTVATLLTERFRGKGPLSADELASITAAECRLMFNQSEDHGPVDELMFLFARALNDLGQLLTEQFDRSFENLVASANQSSEQLAGILARMPLFQDVSEYGGFPVPFYKRAQLTAADLNLSLGGSGLGQFHDLDRLTIFADNLVPHVLRCDGVLKYVGNLGQRIDAGEPLVSQSLEEIEIRAAAVHASELIVQRLRELTARPITAMQIDYLLWNRGQQPEYKSRPRHRARCAFY